MRAVRGFVGAGVVGVALVLVAQGSASATARIGSGTFGAVAWTLSARDSADGHVCLTITLPRRSGGGSSGCGSILGPAAGRARGITFLAHTGAPTPDYIVGPVVATAKTVVIVLANGTTLRTRTIAPPNGMSVRIAFYAAGLSCPALPTSVRGVNSTGSTVAYLAISRLTPRGKTSC